MKFWNAWPVYWIPLSISIWVGRSNSPQWFFIALATAALNADWCYSTIMGEWLYRSMMSRYCIPCISNKSLGIFCHGLIGISWGSSDSRWLTGWISWPIWHCLHNAPMSLLIFVENTLSRASWRVFLSPGAHHEVVGAHHPGEVWGCGCGFPCRWLQIQLQVRHR